MTLLSQVEEAAAQYHAAIEVAADARFHLYATILTAATEGIPHAKIGRSAGLSRERVRQIVESAQAGPTSA